MNQDDQIIKRKAYTVFTITIEGKKEIPDIWIGEAESSKFWMNVLFDLKNRGDFLISSVDCSSGF